MKKGKFWKFLKKNKVARGAASLVVGVLNGNPVTSNFTPSVQNFNETIDNADLNQDGKIAQVKKGELIVYYVLNYLGLLLSFLLTAWGLKNNIDQNKIEWAISLLKSVTP